MTSPDRALVGVLVVSHGRAAQEMIDHARKMLDDEALAGVSAVCVAHGEEADAICTRIESGADQVNAGAGIVVLCDLYGSTPAKCAATLADGKNAVIFGVNLSMLIKLASSDRRQISPQALGQAALETARRSIRMADVSNKEGR